MQAEDDVVKATTFENAIAMLESSEVPPDPNAPSCNAYRLRPSEEAEIALNLYNNPPPPWGKKINLSQSFLDAASCVLLGKKLILNHTVTYLDVSMCDLQGGAPYFFSCVERNQTLKHLSANGNNIGDAGAIAAANCLQRLESLHLASNDISDVAAAVIADKLRSSTTMKTLNLRNNRLTLKGIYSVMDALEPIADQLTSELRARILPDPADATKEDTLALSNNTGTSSTEPQQHLTREMSATRRGTRNPQSSGAAPTSVDAAPEASARRASAEENDKDNSTDSPNNDQNAIPTQLVAYEEEPPTIKYNETLQVLWIEANTETSPELSTLLTTILAKRFPQPPKGAKKKKKKATDGDAATSKKKK